MTTQEFSYQFDVMLRSFAQMGTLVLDEYEKSVYLTIAQEALVKEKYKTNFEQDEDLRAFLRPLIKTVNATPATVPTGQDYLYFDKYKNSYWNISDDLWWIVYEQVTLYDECLDDCYNGKVADLRVVRLDELNTTLKNPFLRPNQSRVIRVDYGGQLDTPYVELISKYTVDSYRVRFIRRPQPIILQDLPDDLTIYGEKTARTSELNTSTHGEILARAVQMAMVSNQANATPAPSQEQEEGK